MEEWRGIKEEEIAEVKRPISNNRNIKWKPPPQQCIKCNTYGAWSKDRQRSGVSWVNRDHMGRLPWAGAKSFQRLGSTNIYIETEEVALNWAVQTMRSLGYKQVIYETDSLVLPKMIAGSEKIWPKLKPIIQDLTQSLSELPGSIV